MWTLLRRWIGPPAFDDPVFGRLVFRRFKENPEYSCWRGASVFGPVGAKVALHIDADEAGPGETQRALYRQIEARWDELRNAAAGELILWHKDVAEEALTDVWSVYRLAEVNVPRRESPAMVWRLGFDSTADPNHLYVVDFKGWEPTGAVAQEG